MTDEDTSTAEEAPAPTAEEAPASAQVTVTLPQTDRREDDVATVETGALAGAGTVHPVVGALAAAVEQHDQALANQGGFLASLAGRLAAVEQHLGLRPAPVVTSEPSPTAS